MQFLGRHHTKVLVVSGSETATGVEASLKS